MEKEIIVRRLCVCKIWRNIKGSVWIRRWIVRRCVVEKVVLFKLDLVYDNFIRL